MGFSSTSVSSQKRHSATNPLDFDEEASEAEFVAQKTGVTNSVVGKGSQWF